MPQITTDGVLWRVGDQRLDIYMTARRYDENTGEWTEGKVDKEVGADHFLLLVEGKAPLPLRIGDTVEIVSPAELYNREMDERDQLWLQSREKPWLRPDIDGE